MFNIIRFKKKNPVVEYLIRLKQFYQANDLFRYALWSFGLMILSTGILTIVEYDLFSGDVLMTLATLLSSAMMVLTGLIHFFMLFGGPL
ncbi:MAG: hypothetical protein Ct9H300mP2_1700 [Candidatus Neomarinimicrobiota bacterium]|nr:MAG: hypothetical protein Ct9H300mP2_1700 [Candidatus Neomarinimicrobiota bacterium]